MRLQVFNATNRLGNPQTLKLDAGGGVGSVIVVPGGVATVETLRQHDVALIEQGFLVLRREGDDSTWDRLCEEGCTSDTSEFLNDYREDSPAVAEETEEPVDDGGSEEGGSEGSEGGDANEPGGEGGSPGDEGGQEDPPADETEGDETEVETTEAGGETETEVEGEGEGDADAETVETPGDESEEAEATTEEPGDETSDDETTTGE